MNFRTTICLLAAALSTPLYANDLLSVYRLARESDPRLKVAEYKVNVGQEQSRQALAQLLPRASGSYQYSKNKRDTEGYKTSDYNGKKAVVSVSQPLFNKKLWHNNNRAELISEQRSLEYQETLSNLMLDAADRYFRLLAAEDRLTAYRDERIAAEQRLEQVQAYYNKRMVKVTELYEVQSRLDTILADEIAAEKDAAIAKEALREITGEEIESVDILAQPLDMLALPDQSISYWMDIAKAQNPRLLTLEKVIEAAQEYVNQSRAGRWPNLDLMLSGQNSNIGYENAETTDNTTLSVTLNLTVPLYEGGAISARKREALYELSIANQQYEGELRSVFTSVRESYLNLNANSKRVVAAERALRSAEKAYESMQAGNKAGTENAISVLDALRDRSNAMVNLQSAKYDLINSYLTLHYAAGTITEDQIESVNRLLL